MAKYAFLSDKWIAEAKKIRDEYSPRAPVPGQVIRMNQVIVDAPFGDGTINAHMDSSSGRLEIEFGHLPDADVTVTVDYETAKAVFVNQDPQAGMQAFMSGRIRVQGDLAKLMLVFSSGMSSESSSMAREIAARIKEITAE